MNDKRKLNLLDKEIRILQAKIIELEKQKEEINTEPEQFVPSTEQSVQNDAMFQKLVQLVYEFESYLRNIPKETESTAEVKMRVWLNPYVEYIYPSEETVNRYSKRLCDKWFNPSVQIGYQMTTDSENELVSHVINKNWEAQSKIKTQTLDEMEHKVTEIREYIAKVAQKHDITPGEVMGVVEDQIKGK
jgi:hypothetical protein